ncbi:MAG TPA: signal peptide peptidase SppA [Stenomitos sp.]
MRTDRLLAALLIIACLFAAITTWWHGDRRGMGTAELADAGSGADIAMIDVYGTISDGKPDGGPFGDSGASAIRLIKAIRAAEKDHVKAILLRINSPGGTAAASQMVYEELMRVRKAGKIKIVTSMGDMTASGGYYIAAASDHIMANPATTTGSIGVILHVQNVQKLFDKLGVGSTVIKSGAHKDILSPFRPMTRDEQALLQQLVNDTYQQFLQAVVAGRKMPLDKLKPLADGRVFTGDLAQKVGLVDSLGNYEDAIVKTGALAGIKGTPKVRNYTSETFWEGIFPKVESKLSSLLSPATGMGWNKIPLALME